jgi:hypothetical protein
MSIRSLASRPVRLALLASALGATPALAGPPWISIEYPVNPFDSTTRGALLMVHTYHHETSVQFPLRVFAEGRVNGKVQRVELTARPAAAPGTWAVSGTLPRGEGWVVSATLSMPDEKDGATALVALTGTGRLAGVQVPFERRNGYVVPRAATRADVDALLSTAIAASRQATAARTVAGPLLAGSGLLLLLPAVLLRRERSRGRRPGE